MGCGGAWWYVESRSDQWLGLGKPLKLCCDEGAGERAREGSPKIGHRDFKPIWINFAVDSQEASGDQF